MQGSKFQLFVNGQRIAARDEADRQATGNLEPSGPIALYADAYDEVVLTDLVVKPL